MTNLLGGLAIGGASTIINNAMAEYHADKAFQRQKELADKQFSQNMAAQIASLPNQVMGAKMAGLNPAMVGQSPGSSQSVSQGSAPKGENVETSPADLLALAQIKNLEAETDKTNAEADKIRGVDTENTIADTLLKNATTEEKNELTQQIKNVNEQYTDQNKALKQFGPAMAQKWTNSDWFKALGDDTKKTIQGIADGSIPLSVGNMKALMDTINTQSDLSDADHKMAKNAFANAVLETQFTNDDLWNAIVEDPKIKRNLTEAQTEKLHKEVDKLKYRMTDLIDEEIDKIHSDTNVNNVNYWKKLKEKLAFEYENMDLSRAEGRYGNYAWRTLENALDKVLGIITLLLGGKIAGKAAGSAAAETKLKGYNTPGGHPKSHPMETRGFSKGDILDDDTFNKLPGVQNMKK